MKNFRFFLSALMLGLVATSFFSCKDDGDDTPDPQNITEVVVDGADFSDLEIALTRANLTSVLEGTGPFTVFAPTNAAFDKAGIDVNTIDVNTLTTVLLYHVLGGASIKSTDLQAGQTYASTASENGPGGEQLSILIEKTGSAVKVNNTANVTTADVSATNGVIHVIDNVILPLDVVGHAAANSNFTSLVSTLGAASGDLVTVLSGDGPFTVFAPVNSAFTAIADVAAGLTADQLAKVLTYHVVSGNVVSGDLSNGMSVTTVNGDTFTVNISGANVTITDIGGNVAKVLLTDVQATNGVIHVIDKVILPSNL
ncbi:MAG: fasciclin domain-containing protein [Saprospiraceae bacterium]|nr:fasciclin domain-containing protein [Saprospiraceae bacterium]